MKNFKIIFAVVPILALIFYSTSSLIDSSNEESSSAPLTTSNEALQGAQDSSADNKETNQADRNHNKSKSSKQAHKKVEKLTLTTLEEFEDIPDEQKRSLIKNSQIMKEFAVRKTRSDLLIEKLRDLEARPLVMNDENPYTGSMKVVRTRSPFPGTRYFHAQYFDNEENDEYVQHMSFEFRPGKQSFEAVKKSIKTAFQLGETLEDKEDFISWREGEDYVIWVKKMDLKDMKDDPFNAYSEEDVGTIRVAKELEIHDQAPSFHMQQGGSESQ